jgi:hypothetical protein
LIKQISAIQKVKPKRMRTTSLNLLIVTIGMMMISFVSKASENNKHVVDSKSSIDGSTKNNEWKLNISSDNCFGSFMMNDNELSTIKDLRFNFSVNQLQASNEQAAADLNKALKDKNVNEVQFTQNHIMILPIMKMAHVIGELKIGDQVHTVPMQMSYTVNEDGSISLNGKQFIKLSAFGIFLPNTKPGDREEEVTINIAINLEKK